MSQINDVKLIVKTDINTGREEIVAAVVGSDDYAFEKLSDYKMEHEREYIYGEIDDFDEYSWDVREVEGFSELE